MPRERDVNRQHEQSGAKKNQRIKNTKNEKS